MQSRRKVLRSGLGLAAASVFTGVTGCVSVRNDATQTQNTATPTQAATPTLAVTSASPQQASREHPVPQELKTVPEEYYQAADQQGTLTDLYYDTYESFSYIEKSEPLQKHAVVYLPYGYSKDKKYVTGSFAFRVKEGYSHGGTAAMEYTYNGLVWFWN